jgi:hypothetical protein
VALYATVASWAEASIASTTSIRVEASWAEASPCGVGTPAAPHDKSCRGKKHRGYKRTRRKPHLGKLSTFLQTNPNWMQDIPVDRGQRLLQHSFHGFNLWIHMLHAVLHLPPVDRREWRIGVARQKQPGYPRTHAPEDLGAGTVSLGVMCPGVPELAPGRGPAPSASMLTVPSGKGRDTHNRHDNSSMR